MEFNIVNELNGKFDPIVLIKSDEIPEDAVIPKEGRGGCVMAFVSFLDLIDPLLLSILLFLFGFFIFKYFLNLIFIFLTIYFN